MFPRGPGKFALVGAIVLAVGLGGSWWFTRRAPQSGEVMVFAAASLRDVMSEVESAFSREYESAAPVRFNIAGSNVLAQQIVASSQADIFLSANEHWMDHVEKAGRLVANTRKPFLSNRIVIVAHASTDWRIDEPADLARMEFEHLSLADPEAVPAGTYAKAFLENTRYENGSLWQALAPKVAPAPDVRAALALVEADPAVVGIVYRTDATSSGRIRILLEIPEDQVPPIHYSAARVYRPDAPATSERFFEFLFSRQAQAVFARRGFVPISQIGHNESVHIHSEAVHVHVREGTTTTLNHERHESSALPTNMVTPRLQAREEESVYGYVYGQDRETRTRVSRGRAERRAPETWQIGSSE